jgi:hypothetical protein
MRLDRARYLRLSRLYRCVYVQLVTAFVSSVVPLMSIFTLAWAYNIIRLCYTTAHIHLDNQTVLRSGGNCH